MFFRTGDNRVPAEMETVETGLGPCLPGSSKEYPKELGRLILSRGYGAHWFICISFSPAAGIGHKSLVSEPRRVQQNIALMARLMHSISCLGSNSHFICVTLWHREIQLSFHHAFVPIRVPSCFLYHQSLSTRFSST